MKTSLFISFMFICSQIFAENWTSYWKTGLENFHNGEYVLAESHFTSAINLMEDEKEAQPTVYADRARVYLNLEKYAEALTDADKALSFDSFAGKERVKATSARVAAKAHLGFIGDYEEDLIFLADNFETHVENLDDFIIINNMPNNTVLRESLADFFVETGICLSKEDWEYFPSGICIVKKASYYSKQNRTNPLMIASCKLWCDNNAINAVPWCINYPEICMVNACKQAIVEIQNNCRNCCQNGFPQEFCAAPFGDILSVMQRILGSSCGCR